jgi:hypothetical protein
MTFSAILGLVAFNLVLFGVGATSLYAIRGLRSWNELVRLAGVAYMLGVALTGIVFVFELVVGLSPSLGVILTTAAVLTLAALAVGNRLGRPRPGGRLTLGRISLTGATFGAAFIVYAEALFRSGRLAGLYEFDGWGFWVPKGLAVYFLGGLDRQFFSTLPGPSYPPVVPAYEAGAFHFMGSPDVVTLHLQFWFFLVGFATAVVGLLSRRAHSLFLWPPLLVLLVAPQVLSHSLQATGDILLDELLALAALLVALWLGDQASWRLAGAAVFLGAAMSVKREGYAMAACVVLAALIVSRRQRRTAWPRLALCGAVAVGLTIPWRLLLVARDLPGGGPEAGGIGLFSHLDRAWPSLRLALSTVFDFDIWLVVGPLALVAIALALLAGPRSLAEYGLLLSVLSLAALTWTTWAFPSYPISKEPVLNPIVRLTGSLAFMATVLVPGLLAGTWASATKGSDA